MRGNSTSARTSAELEDAAREQIRFLRSSCEAYDGGFRAEAKRIASALYILLHDSGAQKSLLRRVGLRDKIGFISAADPDWGSECYVPLFIWSVPDEGGHFVPDFDIIREARDRCPRLRYSAWIQGKLFANANGHQLTRKNLMFSIRNQDGGGHVDDSFKDESYRWLMINGADQARVPMRGGFASMFGPEEMATSLKDGVLYGRGRMMGEPVKDGHLAIMRAMGWEVSETLADAGW